jgi:hypothetical protein
MSKNRPLVGVVFYIFNRNTNTILLAERYKIKSIKGLALPGGHLELFE